MLPGSTSQLGMMQLSSLVLMLMHAQAFQGWTLPSVLSVPLRCHLDAALCGIAAAEAAAEQGNPLLSRWHANRLLLTLLQQRWHTMS